MTTTKLSKEQQEAVFMLELLGLVHDLGKLTEGFVHSQARDKGPEYQYKFLADPTQVYPMTTRTGDRAANAIAKGQAGAADPDIGAPHKDRADLTHLLQKITFTAWDGQAYTLAELVALTLPGYLQADMPGVLGKSMQPALLISKLHGIAHYEKEEPGDHTQLYAEMRKATPFGREQRVGPGTLTDALEAIPLDKWPALMDSGREEWLAEVRTWLGQGIADTRRSTNEVSLWDWAYVVASLAKAAAAWIFQNEWPADLDDLAWRTLSVNVDMLAAFTRSDKISDLLGLRATLDESFREVRSLLERENPLANLIYHDETGLYFLYPDLILDEEFKTEIQDAFPPDLKPQVHLSGPIHASRLDPHSPQFDDGAVGELLAEPRRRALARLRTPVLQENNFYAWVQEWTEGRPKNAEICTVCGMRPVGYPRVGSLAEQSLELARWATQEKAEKRHICRVCLDRRSRRAEEWAYKACKGLPDTIWTDEVADDHGRLALLVGHLDLDGWSDGTLLSSLFVRPKLAKSPSPARLYRIAETARRFWQEVTTKTIPAPEAAGRRPYRLAICPADSDVSKLQNKLGAFHSYELSVDGLAIEVLWDKPNSRFLSTENLAYFHRRWVKSEDLASYLPGQRLAVVEPSAYGGASEQLAHVMIAEVQTLAGYEPVIPLISEPAICMNLIPADTALKAVKAIREKYQDEFSRVRDRLPLHLGLVFFQRHTPMRAVLEAGRAMLHLGGEWAWEEWEIVEADPLERQEPDEPGGYLARELVFANGIRFKIPRLMDDSRTPDIWYPHFYDQKPKRGQGLKSTQHVAGLMVRPRDKSGEPVVLPGKRPWKVYIRPSRFDFEFLDTTARRFEIHYDENGRRPRRTRPFYLDDLERLENIWEEVRRLEKSQRHQVIEAIEATREAWFGTDRAGESKNDRVFRQYVCDTLAGAAWPKGSKWADLSEDMRKKLEDAGVTGELADLAELHQEILKE